MCGRFGLFVTRKCSIEYDASNGVGETLAFREAWTRRPCLILASGFSEWSAPVGGHKRPHFVRPADEPLLALAGLWERWCTPAGDKLETCVIVTTDANAQLQPTTRVRRAVSAAASAGGGELRRQRSAQR